MLINGINQETCETTATDEWEEDSSERGGGVK